MSDTSLIDDQDGTKETEETQETQTTETISTSGDLVEFKFDQAVVEGVPENFIKTEGEGVEQSKVIDLAAFTKSWKDQQSYIQSKSFEPPEKPEEYKFEASSDEAKENATKAFRVDEKLGEDPILHEFRKAAHDLGITQKQFQGVVEFFVNKQGPALDAPIDPEAEKKKLGADWQKQVNYVAEVRRNLEANGTLDDDMVTEMRLAGQTAAGVKMMRALLAYGGGNVVIPKIEGDNKVSRRDDIQKQLRELSEKRSKQEISEAEANRRYKELTDAYIEIVGDGHQGTSIVFTE